MDTSGHTSSASDASVDEIGAGEASPWWSIAMRMARLAGCVGDYRGEHTCRYVLGNAYSTTSSIFFSSLSKHLEEWTPFSEDLDSEMFGSWEILLYVDGRMA